MMKTKMNIEKKKVWEKPGIKVLDFKKTYSGGDKFISEDNTYYNS